MNAHKSPQPTSVSPALVGTPFTPAELAAQLLPAERDMLRNDAGHLSASQREGVRQSLQQRHMVDEYGLYTVLGQAVRSLVVTGDA